MPIFQLIFAIGTLVASYAIQAFMAPKSDPPEKASMSDFDFPQITEGTPQSVVFGDCWISDWLVLWFGDLRTSDVQSDGGKK